VNAQVDLKEFLSGYLAETDEHLSAATKNLTAIDEALRRGEPHPRAVRDLFRSLHTVKGLSGMVGVEPVVELAHEMENVLRAADRAGGRLSEEALDLLSRGLRAVQERVGQLAKGTSVDKAPEKLIDALSSLQPEHAPRARAHAFAGLAAELEAKLSVSDKEQLLAGLAKGRRAHRVVFTPSPALAAQGVTITAVREKLTALAELVKVVPLSVPASPEAPGGLAFALFVLSEAEPDALAQAASVAPAHVHALTAAPAPLEEPLLAEESIERSGEFVRVQVSRLDEALERLSSLVVSRYRLARAVADLEAKGVDVRALQALLTENGRELRDLRAAIMRARTVPVAELLERVPLLVRGLARTSGKQVRLQVHAQNVELDKGVADRVFPALVHLVRNAVDHAIELPAERSAASKPAEGLIEVDCLQRANNQLELRIRDDGGGIDRARVARKANRPVPEDDAGLLELITLPGLSTRDEASQTSGRGMGMDIVRRTVVDELGGELSLESTVGKGTRFTLRIPLSISIVEVFSFECGGETFVAPVTSVEDIVEVERDHVITAPQVKAGAPLRLLQRRGGTVPLLSLASHFGSSASAPRPKALVVRRSGEPFALEVDRMLRQQEVVIRPLEDELARVPGIVGTTDLGDGRPTLVLDLAGIVGAVVGASGSKKSGAARE
jgi:two-component system chemotaxis sensor kinase CheA